MRRTFLSSFDKGQIFSSVAAMFVGELFAQHSMLSHVMTELQCHTTSRTLIISLTLHVHSLICSKKKKNLFTPSIAMQTWTNGSDKSVMEDTVV